MSKVSDEIRVDQFTDAVEAFVAEYERREDMGQEMNLEEFADFFEATVYVFEGKITFPEFIVKTGLPSIQYH